MSTTISDISYQENNTKIKVVGYIRVSTDEQELSPLAQRESLEQWCEKRGYELAEVFEDFAKKGQWDIDKRPSLMAAINAVEVHQAKYLLAIKRDRFARDPILTAMIERMVNRKNGCKLATVNGVGNGDSPEDILMKRMVDAFAEYERHLISSRTSAVMQLLKRQKRYTGGPVLYGFSVSDGNLIENKTEQEVISKIFDYKKQGFGLKKTARLLNEYGYRSRTGNKFQAVQVRNILKRGEDVTQNEAV